MKRNDTVDAQVSVLTGGKDCHYTFGLVTALAARGLKIELIGGDDFEEAGWALPPDIKLINLRGDGNLRASLLKKIRRVLIYYVRLLLYAATARPKIFHILWNSKFELFDRTILMVFYRLLGKKIALTAHNVNAGERDGADGFINRVSLRAQYRLCDAIFAHTNKMKAQLVSDFGVADEKIFLIPFGINNAVPQTELNRENARQRLGLQAEHKVILFFGNVAPYKGLHYLVEAFESIAMEETQARLVIAGRPKGPPEYWKRICADLENKPWRGRVSQTMDFIPDSDIEIYFKAADVLVMPYVHIFQSGILFLAYSFGLPVIATDVGSLKEDIVEGQTGFTCQPENGAALAECIRAYFRSDLYRQLETRRSEIIHFAGEKHSWKQVATTTTKAYSQIMSEKRDPGLVSKMDKHDEALSFDSHSGL